MTDMGRCIEALRMDWAANPRDPKARAVLVFLRMVQWISNEGARRDPVSLISIVLYRLFTEWLLGMEIRPRTSVGPGLSLYHGYGLVVHDHAVIGRNVALRHGVTIGERVRGGPCPVIGDGVEIGAGAAVLGGVTIGEGAKVGAGAVVLSDVAPGSVVVGAPARVVGL